MLDKKLNDILEEAAAKSDEGPSVELLEQTWPTLVGRELARLTRPAGFDDGVLAITVSSPEWKRELEFRRGTLLRRVNHVFPWRVTGIEFQVGDVPKRRSEDDEPWRAPEASTEPVDDETEDAIAHVDSSLKDTLRKIRHHMLRERDE
jgi:hypothetical protein